MPIVEILELTSPFLHFSKERIVGAATLAKKKDGIVATYPHIKKRYLFYCQRDKEEVHIGVGGRKLVQIQGT